MTALVILDMGYGNTRSVALAFERLGVEPLLTSDPVVAERAEKLVFPGVGAAGAAMKRLVETGVAEVVRRRVRPTLGICLGMQLLFERSEEDGGTELLGLLPGPVRAIAPSPGFPVPHMGWSKLGPVTPGMGVNTGDYVYFAHNFACPDTKATVAHTVYGQDVIPAAIRFGPIWGSQFHPERSSAAGARFLQAFLKA